MTIQMHPNASNINADCLQGDAWRSAAYGLRSIVFCFVAQINDVRHCVSDQNEFGDSNSAELRIHVPPTRGRSQGNAWSALKQKEVGNDR
jgi:hypothetical protein